jgi:hypothetical protein
MNMMPSSTSSRYQTAKGTKSTFRYLIPSLLTSRLRRTSRPNDQRSRWPWSAQQTRSSCNRVREQQQMYSSTLQFTIFRRGIVTRSTFFTRRRRPHCRNCRAHASGTCSASLFFPRPRSLAVPHLRSAIDEPPPPAVLQVVGASEGPTGLVIFGRVSSGRRVRVSFQRMTLLRRCTTVVRAAMSG